MQVMARLVVWMQMLVEDCEEQKDKRAIRLIYLRSMITSQDQHPFATTLGISKHHND